MNGVGGVNGKATLFTPFTLFTLFTPLALLVLSCGPRRVVLSPQQPSAIESLQRDLSAIFTAPEFERSTWSVLVRPVASGDNLFSLNSSKLVMPGSNMKILTLAAAADRLGWDYRFETKLMAEGPVESGVLRGDLIVVGGGDPSISERSNEPGVLRALARQLRESGVRLISGGIVGHDDLFDDQGLGDGWAWDNLPYGYAAPVTALEYNEGSVDLVIQAGAAAGDPVLIDVRPEGSGLDIENNLVTVPETGTGMLTMERLPGSSHLVVRGQIPAKAAAFARTASVDNPTQFFVNAFRLALIAEGVLVGQGAIDIDYLAPKPDFAQARRLLTHRSAPLSQLAIPMMKVSQNQYAELLLRAMGGKEGERERLRGLGVPDDSYIIADGSGLSRYNYVTSEALVGILQLLHERPAHASAFPATLPIAGRDGTLARRMIGTPAEGNVRAKTGTVDNLRALSGYVEDADGRTLAFSIIANNYAIPTAQIDAAADKALIRLATFKR